MAYISFQPNDFFATKLYTGNGSTQTISGVGFQPDFTWVKDRDATEAHTLQDAVRGAGERLYANSTAAETTSAVSITSWNSDGFALGSGGEVNTNTDKFVSWNWKAGTTSGLSGGTITPSAYSLNTTAAQGIYAYTGNGTGGATIPHGLGKVPTFIMAKKLNSTGSWMVYHKSEGAAKVGYLDADVAFGSGTAVWNSVTPTTSLITIGTDGDVNGNTDTFVMYAFCDVSGYCATGKFDGNGDTRGCFIQTGFRPAFVMIKRTNGAGPWMIYHDKVPGYNETNTYLQANATSAEDTNAGNFGMSMYATGFQPQSTSSATGPNQDGDDYVYVAFANKPIASSNSIAGTAR